MSIATAAAGCTQQPQWAPRVNWASSLSNGLVLCVGDGANGPVDLTPSPAPISLQNGAYPGIFRSGLGWDYGSTRHITCGASSKINITENITVFAIVYFRSIPSSGNSFSIIAKDTDTGRSYTFDWCNNTVGHSYGTGIRFYINGGAPYEIANSNVVPVAGFYGVVTGRWIQATKEACVFVDGVKFSPVTTSPSSINSNSTSVLIGRRGYPGYEDNADGIIVSPRIWNRALLDVEIFQLHYNPWQVFSAAR